MDQNPFFYLCLVGGLILLALVLTIPPLFREQVETEHLPDWRWGWLVIAILAAGRWPSIFMPREINPDETQMLAGAHALIYDPVFWRSVVGGTAGPLNFFVLWPAGWIFGWDSYLTARLTALSLLGISLIFTHQCVALILGRKVARVAGLAVVCLEALTNAPDLLHYSTELLSITLLSVTAYAAIRRWAYQGGLIWNGLGGLLLGAIPFSKIQAVPLAACAGVGWLFAEFIFRGKDANRRRLYLFVGAILPAIAFTCQLTAADEWQSFIITYIVSNFQYSGQINFSLPQLLVEHLRGFVGQDSLLELLLPMSAIWILLMLRVKKIANQTARIFFWLSFAVFIVAQFCVIYAWHPYIHYWQLMIVPLTFLFGAVVGNLLAASPQSWRNVDRLLVAGGAITMVAALFFHRAEIPNDYIAYNAVLSQKRYSSPHVKLVECIKSRARPGDSIAIWGWAQSFFVETGLRQATRYPNFMGLVVEGPHREYYCKCFFFDFLNSNPAFFLDSTGPQNSNWKDPGLAHERMFPSLATLVRDNYVLIDVVDGARLYQRHDLLTGK